MVEESRRFGPEATGGSYTQTGYGATAATAGEREWERQQPARWAFPGAIRRISWGAVIAGTVIALVVQLMLSLLGIGIGATQVDPGGAAGQAVPEGLGIGAAIWWILSVLISLFIGGWVAGYLAGMPERADGLMHGLVTWGLATIVSLWLLTTTVGAVATGAWNVIEGGLSAMDGQQTAVSQPGAQPGAQQQPGVAEQLQQQAQDVMAEGQQPGQQQGEQTAEQAADAVAQAGIWAFVAMLLGALAAGFGGLAGAPQDAPRTHREEEPPEHERVRGDGRGAAERSAEQERLTRERETHEQRRGER